jgi:heme oxygenase (mycobilin-producing)
VLPDIPDLPGLRVCFFLEVTPARVPDFLAAYDRIREDVHAVPGHLRDQLCAPRGDGKTWLLTSEWRDEEAFTAWERTPEHRTLAGPLRACASAAQSLRFAVVRETPAVPAHTPTQLTQEDPWNVTL